MSERLPVVMIPGEAPGAIPNGTRIRKAGDFQGDMTPKGALGKVLASHRFTDEMAAALHSAERVPAFLYFVEWDHSPGLPVGAADYKIERADG